MLPSPALLGLSAFICGTGAECTSPSLEITVSRRSRYSSEEMPLQQIIFNCGECVTRVLSEGPAKPSKLSLLCATSMHPASVAGLPGLLFHLSDRGAPSLELMGPPLMTDYAASVSVFVTRAYPAVTTCIVDRSNCSVARRFTWPGSPGCSLDLLSLNAYMSTAAPVGSKRGREVACAEATFDAAQKPSRNPRILYALMLSLPAVVEAKIAQGAGPIASAVEGGAPGLDAAPGSRSVASSGCRSSPSQSSSSSSSSSDEDSSCSAASDVAADIGGAASRVDETRLERVGVVVIDCDDADDLSLISQSCGAALHTFFRPPQGSLSALHVFHLGPGPVVHSSAYASAFTDEAGAANGLGLRSCADVVHHHIITDPGYDPRCPPPARTSETPRAKDVVRTHFPVALQQAVRLHAADAVSFPLPTDLRRLRVAERESVVTDASSATQAARSVWVSALPVAPLDTINIWPRALHSPADVDAADRPESEGVAKSAATPVTTSDLPDALLRMKAPRFYTKASLAAQQADAATRLNDVVGSVAAEGLGSAAAAVPLPAPLAGDSNVSAAKALRQAMRLGSQLPALSVFSSDTTAELRVTRSSVRETGSSISAPVHSPPASRIKPPTLAFLGTGAAAPSKLRSCSGLWLRLPPLRHQPGCALVTGLAASTTVVCAKDEDDSLCERSLMLDCGEGAVSRLSWMSRRCTSEVGGAGDASSALRSLRVLWVSHMHADHHSGLLSLLWLRTQQLLFPASVPAIDLRDPLVIIGPPALEGLVRSYSALICAQVPPQSYLTAAGIASFIPLSDGATFTLPSRRAPVDAFCSCTMAALPVAMLRSVRVEHCRDAFGVVVTLPCRGLTGDGAATASSTVLVYSGDTRPCERLVTAAASGVADAQALVRDAPQSTYGAGLQSMMQLPASGSAGFGQPLQMMPPWLLAPPMMQMPAAPFLHAPFFPFVAPSPYPFYGTVPLAMPLMPFMNGGGQAAPPFMPMLHPLWTASHQAPHVTAPSGSAPDAAGDAAAGAPPVPGPSAAYPPPPQHETSAPPARPGAPWPPLQPRPAGATITPPRPGSVDAVSVILVHEATMDDDRAGDAARKWHSTVGEALGVAKRVAAAVQRAGGAFSGVVLTHFSQRYPSIPTPSGEVGAGAAAGAREHAPAGPPHVCAFDGLTVPLAAAPLARWFGGHAAFAEVTRAVTARAELPPSAAPGGSGALDL